MDVCFVVFFFCRKKTAEGMRISAWSSDVCSTDLADNHVLLEHEPAWHQFSEAVLEFTGQSPSGETADAALLSNLTGRERVALALLCEGRSNAQIAWQLGISEKTVRNHVTNLYRKLGVHSRAEAIVLAYRNPSPQPA